MKFAFFWDDRFNDNNYANTQIDPNLSPFKNFLEINGINNTMSFNIFESDKTKTPSDYTILCLLTLNIFSLRKYIKFLWKYRRYRKFLFLMEPPVVAILSYSSLVHIFFDRVYTWNDNLVDNETYRKYLWPQSKFGSDTLAISYHQKKLLTLVNGNKTSFIKNELYSEREKAIRYLEANNVEFDLYGTRWDLPNNRQKIFGFQPYSSYRGRIDNKITALSQYRFSLCFENMKNVPGYITEKIWDSFKARCVPIYWGASNIEEYIPANTFIDFRQFRGDYEKLVTYLSQMTELEYNQYIENIEVFLVSQESQEWFDAHWAKGFLKILY